MKIRTNPLATNATHPIKQGLYGTIQKESITGKRWSNDSPGHGPNLHQTSEQQKDLGEKKKKRYCGVLLNASFSSVGWTLPQQSMKHWAGVHHPVLVSPVIHTHPSIPTIPPLISLICSPYAPQPLS